MAVLPQLATPVHEEDDVCQLADRAGRLPMRHEGAMGGKKTPVFLIFALKKQIGKKQTLIFKCFDYGECKTKTIHFYNAGFHQSADSVQPMPKPTNEVSGVWGF